MDDINWIFFLTLSSITLGVNLLGELILSMIFFNYDNLLDGIFTEQKCFILFYEICILKVCLWVIDWSDL